METKEFDFNRESLETLVDWEDFYKKVGIVDFIKKTNEELKPLNKKAEYSVTEVHVNPEDEKFARDLMSKTWREYNIHIKNKSWAITSKKAKALKNVPERIQKAFSWDTLQWGPNVSRDVPEIGKIVVNYNVKDI